VGLGIADELAALVGALVAEAAAELAAVAVSTGAVALCEAPPSVLALLAEAEAEAEAEWAPELVVLGWVLLGCEFSPLSPGEEEVQAAKSSEDRVRGQSKARRIGFNCHEPGLFVAHNALLLPNRIHGSGADSKARSGAVPSTRR
jgi:hypothetical protein